MNHFCTKCGCRRTQGARFCPKCGNAFDRVQPLPPSPPPAYTGYNYQQPVYQKPAENPKRSLYEKLYRSIGGLLFITLLGFGLFCPIMMISLTYMEELGTARALLIAFSPMAWYPLIILSPVMVVHSRLSKSSVRKERVVLRDKEQFETYIPRGGAIIKQSLTFAFPDGEEKSLLLRPKHMRENGMYDLSVAGDSGTLIYQKQNGKTRLIDFENDNFTVNTKRSLYDKIHHTQGGHVFSTLTVSFSICPMLIGFMFLLFAILGESIPGNPYIFVPLLLFLPAALIGFIYIPRLYVHIKLKSNPEKQLQLKENEERVRLIDKGHFAKHANDGTRRVLVFEMPDKSRKSFQIREDDSYNLATVNDTGILTYKERKEEAVFVSFKPDQ